MSDQAPMQSPEERMLAFVDTDPQLNKEVVPEDEKPSRFEEEERRPPISDAEAADQAEADAEAAEPKDEEETPEDRILRLKHDGVEIEKPESEVIALAQQGYDYTQKTQKLAEDRKHFDELAQTLKVQETTFKQQVEAQNALMGDIAKATAIDQQLSQYQNLDWQALSNTDPVEAQKLFFAYNQLQVQRGQVVAEISEKQQDFDKIQQTVISNQVRIGNTVLTKDIPGWGPDVGKTLLALGKDYGASDHELSKVTEPWIIKALYDAQQWKKLQAEKPIVDKKVSSASPTVKPGAKDAKNAAGARDKMNRDQLRKTGKSDYAAKLIERMI